jgi:hypothetical protein
LLFFSILCKHIGAFDTIWREFNNSHNSHFQFLITVELPESHQTAFHIVLCEQWNVAQVIVLYEQWNVAQVIVLCEQWNVAQVIVLCEQWNVAQVIVLCEQWNVAQVITCQQPDSTAMEIFKLVSKWDRCINSGDMDNFEK